MDDSNHNKEKNTLQLFFVASRSCLQDQAVLLQEGQDKEINMKNDDKRASAFGLYILLLCYKQAVSIYKGKCNNIGKTDEDPTWWP